MTLRSSLRLVAFSLTLLAPALLPAQATDPLHTATRQELNIIKVLLAQENAWNKGDLAGFASSFKDSPDTLFITHQVFRGFAGLLDEYKHDYPNKNSRSIPSTKTSPSSSANTTSNEAKRTAATSKVSFPSCSKTPTTAGRSSSTTQPSTSQLYPAPSPNSFTQLEDQSLQFPPHPRIHPLE